MIFTANNKMRQFIASPIILINNLFKFLEKQQIHLHLPDFKISYVEAIKRYVFKMREKEEKNTNF